MHLNDLLFLLHRIEPCQLLIFIGQTMLFNFFTLARHCEVDNALSQNLVSSSPIAGLAESEVILTFPSSSTLIVMVIVTLFVIVIVIEDWQRMLEPSRWA